MTLKEANILLQTKYPSATISHINEGRKNHTNMKCRVILNNKIYDYKGGYEDVLKRLGVITETSRDKAIVDLKHELQLKNIINPFLVMTQK